MADETPKPKRKRRLWIIAGVLLLLTGIGWWHWPRGDTRFLGKWEWSPNAAGARRTIRVFASNGSGDLNDDAGKRICSFPWTVQDGCLLIGYRTKVVQDLLTEASKAMRPLLGFFPFYPDPLSRWRIEKVSDGLIVLRNELSGDEVKLLRVTD